MVGFRTAVSQLQPYQKEIVYSEQSDGMYGGASQAPSGKEQLERLIDVLYKGKWIILVTFVLVVGATAGYTYTRTPSYQASSMVMLTNNNGSDRSGSASSPALAYASGGMAGQWGRSVSNELTLLRYSRELPFNVADSLMELREAGEVSAAWPIFSTSEGQTVSKAQLAGRIRASVGFSAREDRVLQFSSQSSRPVQAALLANLYATEYVEMSRSSSRASMVASREFLEQQLSKREADLRRIEGQIQSYLETQGTVSIDAKGSQLASQVTEMETRVDQISVELQKRRAALDALQKRLDELQPNLAKRAASTTEQDLRRLQEELGKLKATKQQALIRNPEWEPNSQPQLESINADIRQLQRRIESLAEQYVSESVAAGSADSTQSDGLSVAVNLRNQIANERVAIMQLETERDALDSLVQNYQGRLQEIPGESLQYARLQRERNRAEQMYEFILQQLQQIRLKEEGELGYASLISQASVPSVPVYPQPFRNLMLGAFFGLFVGVGLAYLRYTLDNRLYRPEQVEELGYCTVLIPNMTPLIKSAHGGKEYVEEDGHDVSTSLVALHNPVSSMSEAYRELRTNIQLGLPNGTARMVVITSAGVGEGKSTTACNLAVSFAGSGARTLLIDADMRRPQVHRMLGLPLKPGLTQILEGDNEFDPRNMETHIDNLFVITAGRTAATNASELIGSGRMKDLLRAVKTQFDVVIIDTPPTLAVTDAKLVASRCNSVILVSRAGEAKEEELNRALQGLERVGARILGIVLNGFDVSMAYDYKYRYRDYSKYGHYTGYGNG